MPENLPHQPFDLWFFKSKGGGDTRVVEIKKFAEGCADATELDKIETCGYIDRVLSIFALDEERCSFYRINFGQVTKLAAKVTARGRRLKTWPEPIGFKSQKGLFLERLNFDPVSGSDYFDFPFIATSILGRMDNPEAFCQRIGSIFDPKADQRQTPIFYGPGGGGKTFLTKFLQRLVGRMVLRPSTRLSVKARTSLVLSILSIKEYCWGMKSARVLSEPMLLRASPEGVSSPYARKI